ncbi:MAG: TldD/PmbA family protein [Leptospirales bacterium]|nr:TldD/PmbA family protein [Leptospirales bacterium]
MQTHTETSTDLLGLAGDLVQRMQRRGVDQAEAIVVESKDFSATVRLGEVEALEEATSRGLGLRAFRNGSVATSSSSDFSEDAIERLIDRLLEMLAVGDADPANGLPEADLLGPCSASVDSYDPSLASLSAVEKIERARRAEAAGLSSDPRIQNSEGAGWSDSIARVALANSLSFAAEKQSSSVSLSLSLVGEDQGVKQSDFWYNTHRFLKEIQAPEEIGRRAAERTAQKFGARKVKTQQAPLLLDPLVARRFAQMVFGAASASAIYRQASFLTQRMGQRIAAECFSLIDDATLAGAPGSRSFDGEGVTSRPLSIVENGKLCANPSDAYSARRLQQKSSGHAARGLRGQPGVAPSNLMIAPGKSSVEQLIGSVKSGLYLTQLFGMGYNSVTGDLSQGAAGFWIENGALAYPVQEITVAGNLLQMLLSIEAVASELDWRLGATAAPALLLGPVTIGGE